MMLRPPLLTLALCLVTACDASPSRDAIHFGLSVAPVTLDPRYATDAESYRLCRLLYRSLVDFRADYSPVADLAAWEQLGARHYRFTLGAAGRRFHHGGRLDSGDVKATYDAVLHGAPLSPHRGSLRGVEAVRIVDEDTVDFILRGADPLFPGKLNIGILPAELIAAQHPFHTQPVGSGGMRLLRWPVEETLELERLRDGQRFRFIVTRDATVRVLKLLRGELDLLQGNVPPELVAWAARREKVRISRTAGNYFTYLGFNMVDAAVGDLQLRKVVAHAVDRRAIIKYVFQGAATMAEGMFSPEHWAAASLPPYDYDPPRAREHLRRYREKRGLSPTAPVRLSYKTSSSPFRLRLATVIQHQLQQVGVQVDIQSYDWGTFFGDIKRGNFQMYSLTWVGLKSPDIFRYAFHSEEVPPNGANRGRLQDAEVDALIERAEASDDLAVQAARYRQLQASLHERLVYVPLWRESQFAMARDEIRGYSLHPDGSYDSLAEVSRAQ